jgi:hypothetical protein
VRSFVFRLPFRVYQFEASLYAIPSCVQFLLTLEECGASATLQPLDNRSSRDPNTFTCLQIDSNMGVIFARAADPQAWCVLGPACFTGRGTPQKK